MHELPSNEPVTSLVRSLSLVPRLPSLFRLCEVNVTFAQPEKAGKSGDEANEVSELSPFPQRCVLGTSLRMRTRLPHAQAFRSEYERKPGYKAFAKFCQNMSGQLSAWSDILSDTCRKL